MEGNDLRRIRMPPSPLFPGRFKFDHMWPRGAVLPGLTLLIVIRHGNYKAIYHTNYYVRCRTQDASNAAPIR